MSENLRKSIQVLGKLCVLKGEVKDLPYSNAIFWGILVLINLMMIGQYVAAHAAMLAQVILGVVAHFAMILAGLLALLSYKKMRNRFHKLVIAFVGTQLIFLALTYLVFPHLSEELLFYFVFIIGIWEMAVQGTILKQVFEIKLLMALAWLIGLVVISAMPLLSLIQIKQPA